MTVPIHFLCGMSRSGTTWMSLRVNEHPDAAMFGETMYFGRRYLEPKSPPHYSDTELRKAYAALEGSAFWNVKVVEGANYNNIDPERPDLVLRKAIDNLPRPATPAALFTAVAEAIAEAEGAQVAVEKTPHHLMWIDRIAEAYPEARFVINLRDPYGFTLSYKHQGDRLADHAKDSFGTLYHPAACAMLWRGYARAAQKAQERYGDRIHVVRYDDIQERPEPTLLSVYRFLGLRTEGIDLSRAQKREHTSFPEDQTRPTLDAVEESWITLLCAREMRPLAFDVRPRQASLPALARSAAAIPSWAQQNLPHLRSRTFGSVTTYLRNYLK